MEGLPIHNKQRSKEIKPQDLTPGLERSCATDWVKTAPWQTGIQRIEAYFSGEAYAPHRHDTYSIGYTIKGVQSFNYRGARIDSVAGQVIVLHPDEIHTGEAGTEAGFHYRMLYVEPSLVRDALGESASALPFLHDAVLTDPLLMRAIHAAFTVMDRSLEAVAMDELTVLLADGLLANDTSARRTTRSLIDYKAIRRAKDYLESNLSETVPSDELEKITGLDRYALSRQFRKAFGTSPYRYLTMRRLDQARGDIAAGVPLIKAALRAGFSDQAHMTRQFKAAFGISPGQWRQLVQKTNH
ncbi:AraC family transcriptional regulator [Marivivens sp. LCG002]|uniref:AraC family transcriptional regulator n=1 Tax=Marivivens sp. LCG002 TaxID=3051171 RepID=UPI002552A187|nr:AraC family transcriptional regulator [Marivivens sp. LCG002]WIV49763.1 AraC family transcriptional regulator [Marivivens sp. LCG002]